MESLVSGIPDWLICGVVVVASAVVLQLLANRQLRTAGDQADALAEMLTRLPADDSRNFYRRAMETRHLVN